MSSDYAPIIRELIVEGRDDWIPIDRVIGSAREVASASKWPFEEVAAELIATLIGGNLMVPGELGEAGFVAWGGSSADLIDRVVQECQLINWAPSGGGCWLANTSEGDRLAAVS